MTPLPPGLAGGPVLPCLGAKKGWTGPRTCIKLWHGLTWRDARELLLRHGCRAWSNLRGDE